MAQYIDKDALLAEIEKRQRRLNIDSPHGIGAMVELECLKDTINTLEVKEVPLDTEVYKYMDEHFRVYDDGNQTLQNKDKHTLFGRVDAENIAKHFFELGLKAQKGK